MRKRTAIFADSLAMENADTASSGKLSAKERFLLCVGTPMVSLAILGSIALEVDDTATKTFRTDPAIKRALEQIGAECNQPGMVCDVKVPSIPRFIGFRNSIPERTLRAKFVGNSNGVDECGPGIRAKTFSLNMKDAEGATTQPGQVTVCDVRPS